MNNKRAQSTVEMAVLTVAIVAALISMQVYIKRGLCGKLRGAADSIGEPYAPGKTTSDMVTEQYGTTVSTSVLRKGTSIDYIESQSIIDPSDPEVSIKTGQENVDALEATLW